MVIFVFGICVFMLSIFIKYAFVSKKRLFYMDWALPVQYRKLVLLNTLGKVSSSTGPLRYQPVSFCFCSFRA
jgi:hypothetical protein